jgi:hydrocephalus-inducing protein
MPFTLHIDQDKHKKANLIAFDEEDEEENEEDQTNKEFQIRPAHGTIPPQSDTKIYVDFIPKAIQKYDTFLHVDVDGVGKNIFSLPITAK